MQQRGTGSWDEAERASRTVEVVGELWRTDLLLRVDQQLQVHRQSAGTGVDDGSGGPEVGEHLPLGI
jgi:hypothetical protein